MNTPLDFKDWFKLTYKGQSHHDFAQERLCTEYAEYYHSAMSKSNLHSDGWVSVEKELPKGEYRKVMVWDKEIPSGYYLMWHDEIDIKYHSHWRELPEKPIR